MYEYKVERQNLFTDEGQRTFLVVRDHVQHLLKVAGAVRALEAMAKGSGNSWTLLASLDRMVELGEIRELTRGDVAGQHRVFVAT